MSPRTCGIGSSVILAVAFLLASSVVADNKQPAQDTARDKRVAARIVSPNTEHGVEQRAEEEQRAKEREPRVILRDLRAREGFDVLHDEYESFDRFFRFRRRIAEQGLPSGSYYYYYAPYRSFVGDYISLSEYERFRNNRDRHRREMEVRKAHLLTKHEQALMAGLQLLKQGQYQRAVVALTLAAKLNHGDPACRIHLAQARLARGHYGEAGMALRRALQLQPQLVYADLHLDTYYQTEDEFDRYIDTLDKWLPESGAPPEVHFLLGYLEFQRGNFQAAHVAFERVQRILPADDLTRSYLEITKPTGDPVAEKHERPGAKP
jgi:tetratricopeptide (TPR) repeat protein